jgi:NAD(P)-dependent dehydrogenase (short-subunit alcohol dehydrogenase family)
VLSTPEDEGSNPSDSLGAPREHMSDTNEPSPQREILPEELELCLDVLERTWHLDNADPLFKRMERAVAHLYKAARKRRRAERRAERQEADRALMSGARSFDKAEDSAPGTLGELRRARSCYVCKSTYRSVDAGYHQMCPACAKTNTQRREARVDLGGRRALVTGGRIKVGFHTALKMLRDGAHVTVTTRFPRDAARRYRAEPDFEEWGSRLSVVGIDLRSIPDVLRLTQDLLSHDPHLDVLVNNACQTVSRPPAYYAELAAGEAAPLALDEQSLIAEPDAGLVKLRDVDQLLPLFLERCQAADDAATFPPGRRDAEGLQLDLRDRNSWSLLLDEVGAVELAEVHVVNSMAPFLLASRLKPLLERSPFTDRYVINVSAMEAQFARRAKTAHHPHTNMAKAALNMLTRTSAQDYAQSGIYMCSVDTGWITDENPHPKSERVRDLGFRTPLDAIDGAARVYDPVVRGVEGSPVFDCFLKDYRPCAW